MKEKKALKKIFNEKIYIDIFGTNIYFFDDKEKYNKALDYREGTSYNCHLGVAYKSTLENKDTKEENTIYMLGLFNGDKSCLMHECIHIALFIMEDIGQALSYKDEVLPYLAQTIFIEAQNFMDKRDK